MRICIIGKNSYIGNHIDQWLSLYGHNVFQLDVLSEDWSTYDYSSYDREDDHSNIYDNEMYD